MPELLLSEYFGRWRGNDRTLRIFFSVLSQMCLLKFLCCNEYGRLCSAAQHRKHLFGSKMDLFIVRVCKTSTMCNILVKAGCFIRFRSTKSFRPLKYTDKKNKKNYPANFLFFPNFFMGGGLKLYFDIISIKEMVLTISPTVSLCYLFTLTWKTFFIYLSFITFIKLTFL